tara:strand:+ start:6365 stop:6571 length:207 start_codon:yes stop_codon:yes gene_type:complete
MVRGVQALPPRQAETWLHACKKDSVERSISPQIKLEQGIKQEEEIKEEEIKQEPFTIRGYFGLDEGDD